MFLGRRRRLKMLSKRCLVCGLAVVLFLSMVVSHRGTEAAPPIKIGYITPLTGPFARIGADLRDGWVLHFGEFGNKVGGRDIQLIVEDTEGKPEVGLVKTRKLVEKDKVDMLAGIFSTGVAYALRDYVHNQKIPLMITNAGADDLTKQKRSPYLFRSSLSSSQLGLVLGDWIYRKLGKRKMVILGQDYPGSWEWCGSVALGFVLAGGKVIQELYTPMGTTDFAPFPTALNRDADVASASI
jgi:branched-chain amino acid transport system substrate-binding protein